MSESPKESSGPSAQRIKKREVDRRCQRLARQRTKSRLATLEALVEEFQKNDDSGRAARLMTQISELTNDKEKLLKALRSAQNALDINLEDENQDAQQTLAPRGSRHEDATPSTTLPPSYTLSQAHLLGKYVHVGGDPMRRESISTASIEGRQQSLPFLNQDATTKHSLQADGPLTMFNSPPEAGLVPVSENSYTYDGTSPLTGRASAHVPVSKYNDETSAACPACADRTNLWRYANETLIDRPKEDAQTIAFEDRQHEETPLLAVMHGWDEVERMGKLTPAWRTLSKLDKVLFQGQLGDTERIAVIREMHTLMMYHIDPSWDRLANLPTWFFLRPSQTLAHSYASDYFAWPGVRERFVYSEHKYCGNIFWQLFNKNFRILWPYEFRDCYTKNVQTGQLQFSVGFRRRIRDINVWAMGSDFFKQFPEMQSDIPQWNSIPKQVGGNKERSVVEVGSNWDDDTIAGDDEDFEDKRTVPFRPRSPHGHQVNDARFANIWQPRYGDGSMTLDDIANLERNLREYV